MKHKKTSIIGLIVAIVVFSNSFNIYTFTPEQSDALQQIAIAVLAFFAADGSAVTGSLIAKFRNLGKGN